MRAHRDNSSIGNCLFAIVYCYSIDFVQFNWMRCIFIARVFCITLVPKNILFTTEHEFLAYKFSSFQESGNHVVVTYIVPMLCPTNSTNKFIINQYVSVRHNWPVKPNAQWLMSLKSFLKTSTSRYCYWKFVQNSTFIDITNDHVRRSSFLNKIWMSSLESRCGR